MRLFGREVDGIPKLIVVFASILVVSSGLCGLQILTGSEESPTFGGLYIITGIVELGLMLISAGGIILCSTIWVAQAAYERFAGRRKEQSLELSKDEKDDSDAL
jgi:hypothetical protein